MAEKILHHNTPIDCMAFNADCSQLAIALANHNVEIYQFKSNGKWARKTTLEKHVARVTGIDWAPNSNKIVTCSSDRNAYVWEPFGNDEWNPVLVILRIARAATTVKWSPHENKFAVGSAARQVTVCYYEKEQKCWVSKHIKKPIKSTVTCVSWHPNNYLLAVGSSDNHCRVYSAFVKDIESKGSDVSWGSKMSFANCLAEHRCAGWVTSCSFNAAGTHLAFVAHDSTLQICGAQEKEAIVYLGSQLPFCVVEWSSDCNLIAAGHDRSVFGFNFNGSEIVCEGKHTGMNSNSDNFIDSRQMFRNRDTRGTETGIKINTVHVAPICDLKICVGEKGNIERFATCSSDGKIYAWTWTDLCKELEALKL